MSTATEGKRRLAQCYTRLLERRLQVARWHEIASNVKEGVTVSWKIGASVNGYDIISERVSEKVAEAVPALIEEVLREMDEELAEAADALRAVLD